MGSSNFLTSNDDKLARLRGTLIQKRNELRDIQASVARMSELHDEIGKLEKAIEQGTAYLEYVCPNWSRFKTAPITPNIARGDFKIGERGRLALTILREATEGLTAREITIKAFEMIGITDVDRKKLDRATNGMLGYLKKHKGELVESDGGMPQKWSVIR